MGELNLTSPDCFTHGFPHGYFRRMRKEQPISWHQHPDRDRDGYFVLSKYSDIRYVSKNPKLFCSSKGITLHDGRQIVEAGVEYGQHSILYMDPPEHIRYRKLISTAFLPRNLRRLEPHIRNLADKIVSDAQKNEGEFDFVIDIASELPLQVIAEFIGVPKEQRHIMFECSNKMVGAEDPEYASSPESMTDAATQLYLLADQLVKERSQSRRRDIVSQLMDAEVDGVRLTDNEFNGFFVILVNAGNETTRNQTSQGFKLLFEHPDQLQLLCDRLDDQQFVETAIEEMLRFNPPVLYFTRTATQDTELRGVQIKAGQTVAMYYPSANRDEEIFEDPDRFDICRSNNPHIAFGAGEHYCMGANLARMQLRSIFSAVLKRMKNLRRTGTPVLLYSHFIDGIKHMPVTAQPEQQQISN